MDVHHSHPKKMLFFGFWSILIWDTDETNHPIFPRNVAPVILEALWTSPECQPLLHRGGTWWGKSDPPKQGQRRWFERRVWCSLHLIFGWECLVRGRPTQKSWFSKENKPGSQASWTLVNDGGTNVTGGDPRIFPLKWSLKPEEWSVLAPKSPRDQMVVCWGYVIELAAGASGSKWMPKILDQDSPLLRRSKKPSNCGPRLWNGRLWSLWSVFVGNIC